MFESKDFTLGQINALVKKLGGAENAQAILRDELPLIRVEPGFRFPVWKRIELGTYRTNTELFDAIRSQDMVIDEFAADLGKRTRLASSQRTVDLVRIRVGTLCWGSGTDGDAQRKAQQIGLQICPPEVGFQLRRQYLDQPAKETLIIAMKEMGDFDGDVSVLSVLNFPEHNEGLAIHGVKGHAGWQRSADTWLVFIQPR